MRTNSAMTTILSILIIAASAEAGTLNITPTRLTVTPGDDVVAFNLRNGGDQQALVEVQVFEWTDVNNPKALSPTRDLLIVPPIVEVPANQTQVLRLAPRLADVLDKERMYRLILKEVPSVLGDDNGVGFAVEMSLPIFMVPEGAKAEPAWSLRWKDVATPELVVANQGKAHLRVRSFGVFVDPGGEPIVENDDPAYVLAGNERAWALEAEVGHLKGPLTIKAETTAGLLQAVVPMPDG